MPMHAAARPMPPASIVLLLAVTGFMAQALLWTNPGYFSHDELQWGAFADVDRIGMLPWQSWFDVATFQFRPLTFNAWLLLSWLLFDSPRLFHAVVVAIGTANALLLFGLLRRRYGNGAALAGFVVFLLGPYSAFVHGWVATLADLLWVAAALLVAWVLETRQRRHIGWTTLGVFVLTAAALLAKEAALAIAGLIGIGWLLQPRDRQWTAALLAASLAAVLYLALRLSPIDAGAAGGSYAWSLGNIPVRLAEYFVFPFLFERSEPTSTWLPQPALHWVVVVLSLLLLAVGLLRAGWRTGLLWTLAMVVALGPTLLLAASSSQYGYGFAAVLAAAVASAWRRCRYWLLFPLIVWTWHGFHVQKTVHEIGAIQQRFHGDLIVELQRADATTLQLWAPHRSWVFHRLTHEVPSWRGVPIGNRVQVSDHEHGATHQVQRDGSLLPIMEAR